MPLGVLYYILMKNRIEKSSLSKRELKPREKVLLKKISAKIRADLMGKKGKSVEWLAVEADIAISTLRSIMDSDPKLGLGVITLYRIARTLGYKGLEEFFADI